MTSVSIFSFFMILQDSIRVQSKSQKRCTVNKFGRWCGEVWCDFNMFPPITFASVEKPWPSIESKQYTCSPKKKKKAAPQNKKSFQLFCNASEKRLSVVQTLDGFQNKCFDFWNLYIMTSSFLFRFCSSSPAWLAK